MIISEFVAKHNLVMGTVPCPLNPNMSDDAWSKSAAHFYCTIYKLPQKHFHPDDLSPYALVSTYYSEGNGFKLENGTFAAPSIDDVLDCLRVDAAACEMSFGEWCMEFGYDTDSRKAESTYYACVECGFALRKGLGYESFQELLRDVEGL